MIRFIFEDGEVLNIKEKELNNIDEFANNILKEIFEKNMKGKFECDEETWDKIYLKDAYQYSFKQDSGMCKSLFNIPLDIIEEDVCDIIKNDFMEKLNKEYEKFEEFIEKHALTGDGYIEKRICENCNKEFEKGGIKLPELVFGKGFVDLDFCSKDCIKEYKKID